MKRSPSALRRGRPVWLAERNGRGSPRRYPSLRGRHTCDVAIVGGGMTGALVAATFAAEGISVAVLESGRVGSGSTVASSALLLQESDQGLAQLARRYGRVASQRIWQLGQDAVRDLIERLRRHRIACDLVELDAIHYATTADAVRRLRSEFQLRQAAGFDGDWLTPGALRRLTGVPGRAAIRTRGNAQFNPFKACHGLMHVAAMTGADIYERSPVTRIHQARDRVRVHTRSGHIEASRVVIATGYATRHFRPLAGRFRMYHTYVLATPPLSIAERRQVGIADVMLWDTERPYHYARWTSTHRLLLGGGDRPVRRGRRRNAEFASATNELRGDFEALLPALSSIDIEHAWEGLFAMTPDSLPYIGPHRRYPRHLFALGYGGNGMTFGSLAARLLLEHWRGIQSPDQGLFSFGRLR
jgi:glycine/D-amino acid oxidase-like deaminating enzyme